jgi:hypothetical protein
MGFLMFPVSNSGWNLSGVIPSSNSSSVYFFLFCGLITILLPETVKIISVPSVILACSAMVFGIRIAKLFPYLATTAVIAISKYFVRYTYAPIAKY